VSPATPTSPGWHPDPEGRHAYRYFDGQRWTEHVSDGHAQRTDRAPEPLPELDLMDLIIPGRDHRFVFALAQRPQTANVFQHFAFAGMFLIGATLVSFGLLGASCHTRGRAAAQDRAAMIADLEVRAISADAPDPADVGRLVHVSGLARAERPVVDDQMGVSMNALVLERTTSMYQWIETCTRHDDRPLVVGSDVHVESDVRRPTAGRLARGTVVRWTKCKYEKGWKDEPQAIHPGRVERYGNPPFPVEAGTHRYLPILWSVGKLMLSSDRLPELPTGQLQPMSLTQEHLAALPEALHGRGRIHGSAIHVGDPKAPKVGDLRIEYVGRTEMTLTLIGERHGQGLRPHRLPDGTELYQAREGVHSAEELAGMRGTDASDAWHQHVWFAAFVVIGTFLVFWPIRAWGRFLPGPALVTGASVLLFTPLAAAALYGTVLARAWWTPDRRAAVVAAAIAGSSAALLLVASTARELLRGRGQAAP
jgi:hypothetical protein